MGMRVRLKAEFDMIPDRDFKTTFSGKHDNSILGVANKDYDAAPIANSVKLRMIKRNVIKADQVKVIYKSQTFPTTGFGSNIVRPAGWEGSEFEAKALSLREALGSLDSDGPQNPQDVADAIARAAVDPTMPFRTLVGADAEMIVGAKSAMSFEEFETAMRSTINWHD